MRQGSIRNRAIVRLRTLLTAGMAAGLVLAALFLLPKPNQPDEVVESPDPVTEDNPPSRSIDSQPNPSNPTINAGIPSPAPRPDASTNSLDDQIFELIELGARNDPESLQKILVRLRDSKPEIRAAALEATIQFGSRDAIPFLKELAAETEDAHEKVALLDAVEFLELPSFREVRDRRRANTNDPAPVKK